ncbi:hypothetical protein AYL99_11618 [Fonsecaea erecta]|uniref:Uncharacterized protein n=1 Tax=Fonsecaea erecta TaxID=1367422 RepID=A0A178Z306_9EURO|nr:hypothetical protein AYL99_11618 [Fonsecaea erecta]OAP54084.1 hypothetical protein AYL99_11618 [Fonsecaea erecta]
MADGACSWSRVPPNVVVDIDAEEDADGDDARSCEVHQPGWQDVFNITAQSATLQLDAGTISGRHDSLRTRYRTGSSHRSNSREQSQWLGCGSLMITRDRDAYWHYRLDRNADARKVWEESMPKIAHEHQDLEKSIAESEDEHDEEFFDAIDEGKVESTWKSSPLMPETKGEFASDGNWMLTIVQRFHLGRILKSVRGKDMTTMALSVSSNGSTYLLQRVAEDMEYAGLLEPEQTRCGWVGGWASSRQSMLCGIPVNCDRKSTTHCTVCLGERVSGLSLAGLSRLVCLSESRPANVELGSAVPATFSQHFLHFPLFLTFDIDRFGHARARTQ